jgi:DNA-binding beta-propeller fold protein YncE
MIWRGRAVVLAGAAIAAIASGGALWSSRATTTAGAPVVTVGVNPVAMIADGASGHVFVLSSGYGISAGVVTVLDAGTGRVIRTTPLGRFALRMVVAGRAGRVFVSNEMSGGVDVLDARTGRLLGVALTGPAGPGALLGVAQRAGRVFVSQWGPNRVATLDARTGRVLRTVSLACGPQAGVADERTGRVFVPCDGVNGRPSRLVLLDARSGALVGSVAVPAGQPFAGRVCVNNRTGTAYMEGIGTVSILDGRTGATRRTIALGSRSYLPMAVDDATGRLLVVDATQGTVRVLDGTSGRPLGSMPLAPAPYGSYDIAVDKPSQRAFITGQGKTLVLDTRSGRQLRSIPVSGYVAVAGGARHFFIATAHEGQRVGLDAGLVHLHWGSDAGTVNVVDLP